MEVSHLAQAEAINQPSSYARPVTTDLPAVLARLDEQLAAQFPMVHANLRPGVTESELDTLEAEHGMALPLAFRQLYRWHDGQERAGKPEPPPLFGSLHFWPLSEVRKYLNGYRDDPILDEFAFYHGDFPSHPPGHIQPDYLLLNWLRFADSPGAIALCLDLQPDELGAYGQVIFWSSDDSERYVLAGSLEDFMLELLTRLERGMVRFIDEGAYGHLNFTGSEEENVAVPYPFAGFGAAPFPRN